MNEIETLFAALDAQRRSRRLEWTDVAREINGTFSGSGATPISTSTLTGMRRRAALDADGVLQMLLWLGRSPESLLPGREGEPKQVELLPQTGPGRILRFDTRAVFAALDGRRSERGMTWGAVAVEIGALSPSSLTRLAGGGRIAFPGAMRIFAWLGRPASSFTRAFDR